MKKLILAILAVGSVASVQAQKPGSVLLYGNVGVHTDREVFDSGLPGSADQAYRTTSWDFAPGVGYQFNKHFTAGLHLGISTTKSTNDDMGNVIKETRGRDLSVGLFFRHTQVLNKTFFLFNQANISYLNGNEVEQARGSGLENVDVYNGFGINWFPAVGINFTRCMALNFSFGGIGYNQRTWDLDNTPATVTNSGFAFTFGRQFNVGISANLGGTYAKKRQVREPRHRHHIDLNDDDAGSED